MQSFNSDALNAELSRRSLLAFAQRMVPGYETPKHIKIIAGLLEDLEAGRIKRLCLQLPPRSGKSTLASALFSAWILGRNPRREIILASHSQELATGFSRQAKQFVESALWPFGRVELSDDSHAIHRWNSKDGGGLFAVGVGGAITGKGADFLVIDDACDRANQAEMDNAWGWFRSVAFPRQNANARCLVIGARLAPDDLSGRIQESDMASEWTFVSLPAINAPDNVYGLPPGEPLWPERFNHDELRQRREAMGLGPFAAQFMQDTSVASGGRIFKLEDFGEWTTLPRPPQRPFDPLELAYISPLSAARVDDDAFVKICAIDCASSEDSRSQGSYTAIITLLCDLVKGEYFIIDCNRWRGIEFSELRNNIVCFLARHNPSLTVLEHNDPMSGRLYGDLQNTTRYPLRAVKPRASKIDRALLTCGTVEAHRVFLPAKASQNVDDFKAEIAAFSASASKTDYVDAFTWGLLAAQQYVRARRADTHFAQQLEGFSLFG